MGIGVLSGVGRRSDLETAWYGSHVHPGNQDHCDGSNPGFHILPTVGDIVPLVLPTGPIRVRQTVTDLESVEASPSTAKGFKLIIVDKNGTLTNVHPRWSNWAEELASRLE